MSPIPVRRRPEARAEAIGRAQHPRLAPVMPDFTPPPAGLVPAPPLTRTLVLVMAASVGATVANLYYNQPMLGAIGADLAASPAAVGLIPTATQLGFGLGLLLLVPLGDQMDRRRLILAQSAGLAVALVAAALAPGAATLVFASVAVGLGSALVHQIVPLAAEMAPPERRGATVGTVMSGLLLGILLARVVSGAVAALAGWRAMFWLGAGLAVLIAALLARTLPSRRAPPGSVPYGRLLLSLLTLVREEPALRRAALTQAALFGSFSAFWSILALRLQTPPFAFGSFAAGLFGLVGAVGVLAAPLAGRTADARGPYVVIALGTTASLAAWVFLGLVPGLAGLIVGVLVLDLGVQMTLIANQAVIFALRPQSTGRVNTVFMVTMFLGGALGSLAASMSWARGGWALVATTGALFAAVALLLGGRRRP